MAADVLQYRRMSHTITVRLTPELAAWLKHASATTGVSQGRIIREQLERARENGDSRQFMRLAGAVRGPRDLSIRKGFSNCTRVIPCSPWTAPISTCIAATSAK